VREPNGAGNIILFYMSLVSWLLFGSPFFLRHTYFNILTCRTEACPNAASATNPACSTDADCTTLLNRPGYVCEYNVDGFCRGGRVCGRRQSAATCNSRQSKKAKRELEKVFDDAGNAYLLSHAASTIEKRKSRVERK
jgi:hypothetical protein